MPHATGKQESAQFDTPERRACAFLAALGRWLHAACIKGDISATSTACTMFCHTWLRQAKERASSHQISLKISQQMRGEIKDATWIPMTEDREYR